MPAKEDLVEVGDPGSYWKSIFYAVLKVQVLTAVAGSAVGALFGGVQGCLGFLWGTFLVFAWFSSDVFVAHRAEKKSMASVARWLMAVYCLKVFLGFIVIFSVPLPEVVLNGWMLAGAIFSVCVWLGVSMRTIMKLKILYFDSHD